MGAESPLLNLHILENVTEDIKVGIPRGNINCERDFAEPAFELLFEKYRSHFLRNLSRGAEVYSTSHGTLHKSSAKSERVSGLWWVFPRTRDVFP